MQESEKWKWSRSVVSDPQRPHGLFFLTYMKMIWKLNLEWQNAFDVKDFRENIEFFFLQIKNWGPGP